MDTSPTDANSMDKETANIDADWADIAKLSRQRWTEDNPYEEQS